MTRSGVGHNRYRPPPANSGNIHHARTRSLAWSELKIGIAGVVALGLLALIVVAVGGEGGYFWQRYPLKTRFADVLGLKAGAVVRLSGKEIGSVTGVEFAGRTPSRSTSRCSRMYGLSSPRSPWRKSARSACSGNQSSHQEHAIRNAARRQRIREGVANQGRHRRTDIVGLDESRTGRRAPRRGRGPWP